MHKNRKYRLISSILFLLLALTYVGIWVVYLFVATPETQTKYESVIELFIYAVNPENEGALFFQGTLLTIVLSAVLAWMVLKAKKLKMVIILGIINAVFALYMFQWHEIAIAVGAVVPLLIEAGNA